MNSFTVGCGGALVSHGLIQASPHRCQLSGPGSQISLQDDGREWFPVPVALTTRA